MKKILFAAAASLALLAGASSVHAQDRGSRGGPASGYDNRGGWDNDDDNRYRGYDQGNWRLRSGSYWNGNRRMSPAEYQRWRHYQQYRQGNRSRQSRAYQQGVRDGRRQANRKGRGSCGNGRW